MAGYSQYTDLVVTTLEKRSKKLADNILGNNTLLAWLKKRGNVKLQSGGRVIVEPLMYPGGSNFKRYSGYEALDVTPVSFLTAAEFPWAQASVAVSASGLEIRSNEGETQLFDLLEARIEAAEKDLMNNISVDIFSDGSADGGKQLSGLDALIAEDPSTGTVGGIDRSANSWWQNSTSGDLASPSAANIQGSMNTRWLDVVRGSDAPDLIVADATFFSYYWNSLQAIQRISTAETGASGFRSLEFMGPSGSAQVFMDSNCPSNRMYMINSKYLFFKPHKNAYFTPSKERMSVNQDAMTVPILFQGALTMSNASLQAVLWT